MLSSFFEYTVHSVTLFQRAARNNTSVDLFVHKIKLREHVNVNMNSTLWRHTMGKLHSPCRRALNVVAKAGCQVQVRGISYSLDI